ncbi:LANO_0C09560g1_1 [Lachancea nothofagi CBS 11611]|uniref:Pre-mRNA-splicing factor CWC22 n=1 Tax=Lachancea nothofagi CBS 11611 TaxID=1266666 RepID=A0A1G4JA77_9SACH|nr:LANO_0C09560g1_1 [Lachancea nothofagi CBS 11611]
MSADEKPDSTLQKEDWERIKSNVSSAIDVLNTGTVFPTFQALFAVNLVRGQRLLVNAILQKSLRGGNNEALAAVASLINSQISSAGLLLVEETTLRFLSSFERNDAAGCYSMASLISQLFNYDVAHEIVVLQVLHVIMEHPNSHSIRLAIEVLRQCGRELSAVAKTAHDLVYESIRTHVQDNNADKNMRKEFDMLFELRKRDYHTAVKKIRLPRHEPLIHTFLIDFDGNLLQPNENLDEFIYDQDFSAKEDEFEAIKLNQAFYEEKPIEKTNITNFNDKTQSQELEFKKKVYLTLKGSLSGDEAAHKLLKLRIPDDEKSVVAETLIMACSQETTYSKFYGITAERLCSSHQSWKSAFSQNFEKNYNEVDGYNATQVRNMGKLWGHILASDYVGLEVFKTVHMNVDETTSAGRVYLKFLFQELVLDLGVQELKKRLDEPYILPYLVNMFPLHDIDSTRFSINFFTAIGLGPLTDKMRQALESEKLAIQENENDEEVNEHKDEEDVVKLEEDQTSRTWEKFNRARRSKTASAETPTRRRSRTPTRRRSRTPTRRRSRTPIRRRSRTPSRRSRSPQVKQSFPSTHPST